MIFYMHQFGIHPSEIGESKNKIDEQLLEIEELAKNFYVVAIGECRTRLSF